MHDRVKKKKKKDTFKKEKKKEGINKLINKNKFTPSMLFNCCNHLTFISYHLKTLYCNKHKK